MEKVIPRGMINRHSTFGVPQVMALPCFAGATRLPRRSTMLPRLIGVRLILSIVIGVALLLVPRPASAESSSLMAATDQCAGYAEARTYLQGQGWWLPAGEDFFSARHLHIGACVPLNQTVSGTLPLDVTITIHNQAARILYVAAGTDGKVLQLTRGCYGYMVCVKYSAPVTCTTDLCSFTVRLDLPTNWVFNDGRRELQLAVGGKRPDGTDARAGFSWMSTLANGHLRLDSSYPFDTRGSGWAQQTKYTIAAIDSVPAAPVSGTWLASLRTIDMRTPVTEYEVLVDPDIHNGSRGTVIASGSGPFTGSLLIDTRQFANGPHKLFFRLGAQVADGTNSGVSIIPFTVQN